MGIARCGLLFGIVVTLSLSTKVECGWNENYINDSLLLTQVIPYYQCDKSNYFSNIQEFLGLTYKIEQNRGLVNKIIELNHNSKINFPDPSSGLIIKKRLYNNIDEAYAWELSYLLEGNNFITPSFPLQIGNNTTIIQKWEYFKKGAWLTLHPPQHVIKKVSLENYWKAHFLAFILGHNDLSGANIGITPRGTIRFFDNEGIFQRELIPKKTQDAFFVSFVSVSFDWPQYRMPIDKHTAQRLREFIIQINKNKPQILLYSEIRGIPKAGNFILENIEILNQFDISEGKSFLSFIGFLYPTLIDGLDKLNKIVAKVLHPNIDHGVALFFATRMVKYYNLSIQIRNELNAWIDQYVSS